MHTIIISSPDSEKEIRAVRRNSEQVVLTVRVGDTSAVVQLTKCDARKLGDYLITISGAP